MGKDTNISWTESTWNPWRGCRKISSGCKNCYMFRDQKRYGNDPSEVVRCTSATFNAPLKWKEPRMIFTCSWSDWFIEEADAWRDEAWEIIRNTPHHTYQILTKRPERIEEHLPLDWDDGYPNVWLGVSAEDQKTYVERMPILAAVPAKIRFLSLEPLLSRIQLYLGAECSIDVDEDTEIRYYPQDVIRWVIVGGESGTPSQTYGREMIPEWVEFIRDQCVVHGVPFFFKQWGGIPGKMPEPLLDGQYWRQMPEVRV